MVFEKRISMFKYPSEKDWPTMAQQYNVMYKGGAIMQNISDLIELEDFTGESQVHQL